MKQASPLEAEQIAEKRWPGIKRKAFTDLTTTAHLCQGRLKEIELVEFVDPSLGSARLYRCDCGVVFIYMHIGGVSDE